MSQDKDARGTEPVQEGNNLIDDDDNSWLNVVPDIEEEEEPLVPVRGVLTTPTIARTLNTLRDDVEINETIVINPHPPKSGSTASNSSEQAGAKETEERKEKEPANNADNEDLTNLMDNLENIDELQETEKLSLKDEFSNQNKVSTFREIQDVEFTEVDEPVKKETILSREKEQVVNQLNPESESDEGNLNAEYEGVRKKVKRKRIIASLVTLVFTGVVGLGVYEFSINSFTPNSEIAEQVEKHYNTKVASIVREDNGFKEYMLDGSTYRIKTSDGIEFEVATTKDKMLKEELHFNEVYPKELKQKEITALAFSTQGDLRSYGLYLTDVEGVHINSKVNKEGTSVVSYTGSIDMYYKQKGVINTKTWGTLKGTDYDRLFLALQNFSFLLNTLDINLSVVVANSDKYADVIAKEGYSTMLDGQYVITNAYHIPSSTLTTMKSGEDLKEYLEVTSKTK